MAIPIRLQTLPGHQHFFSGLIFKAMKANQPTVRDQIFSIPIDAGRMIIYAPLKRIAFIVNQAMANAIVDRCKGNGANHDDKEHLRFLEHLHFFEPETPPNDLVPNDGSPAYDTVVLFLTNQCNLRCTYCYASSGDYPERRMSWEMAKAAIDLVLFEVAKRKGGTLTLGFHGGGEPSMNWTVLKRSVEHVIALAKQYGVTCQISGAFNGSWSQRTLDFILNHFTEISLSFDGTPKVQNAQRPTSSNHGSSSKVERTLRALDQALFSYGIRMTVTEFSVDALAESVRYICENFSPKRIQAEPVFASGRAVESRSAIRDQGLFVDRFLEALEITRRFGIELFYSGARIPEVTTRFCLAPTHAFIVTPEGDVTTCFEVFGREHPESQNFVVGQYIGNGCFEIDSKKLGRHLARTVEGLSYCRDCYCRWSCAGDCAAKTCIGRSADSFRPSERCFVNQEITKHLLLDKIRQSGGHLWNGRRSP
jgi:uncharacterized protein